MVDRNKTKTSHIIMTTIGDKNGQPKQVLLTLIMPYSMTMPKYVYLCLMYLSISLLKTLIFECLSMETRALEGRQKKLHRLVLVSFNHFISFLPNAIIIFENYRQ